MGHPGMLALITSVLIPIQHNPNTREPWRRVRYLRVRLGAHGPRCVSTAGSLFSLGTRIGAGHWGLNIAIAPDAVLCLEICINSEVSASGGLWVTRG